MARNMYVNVRKLLQDGLQLPVPDVLPFSDDFCLFYSGSFNLIYGDTESGKTVHAEVIKPLTRNGASVLVVDHLAKNADSRSFGPTGTAAKMRAADGVAIRVTADRQFTPGSGGTAKLQVYKDRYGGVRNNYPSDPKPVIGTFELISDGDTLDYAFHSAQVVPIRKARKDDGEQLAEDVAKLREIYTTKPKVRDARETLKCKQDRAMRAVNAFTDAEGEAVA
jgi:hypothetical protein